MRLRVQPGSGTMFGFTDVHTVESQSRKFYTVRTGRCTVSSVIRSTTQFRPHTSLTANSFRSVRCIDMDRGPVAIHTITNVLSVQPSTDSTQSESESHKRI
eukprot:5886021-Prymnesium_polylepis.2